VDAWHRADRGESTEQNAERHVGFQTFELFARIMTPRRLELLRHVYQHTARSVRALAHCAAAIETVPGRVSGQPMIRGTRVRPQDLLANRNQGVEWLAKGQGLEPDVICEVFAFYDANNRAPVPHKH
jgi:uncharacterized protein (DUF433 family)